MFCSVVIPTIGRDSLTRTVNSVLKQRLTGDDFEIIVVNDSGTLLSEGNWQNDPKVQVITTNRRERCYARNTGASVARGDYLWFLDDDDWMLPGALSHFKRLATRSVNAVWLYGGLRIVNAAGDILGESNSGLHGNCFAHVIGGAWVPIQSSIIKSEAFFRAGGYNPFILGTEDLDLCRRLALEGNFANMEEPVACLLRGDVWETSTNYGRAPADTRKSRDDVLDQPDVLRRALNSIDTPYWYGRMVRVYLSTVRYNLEWRRVLTAFSRGYFMLIVAILAGHRCLTKAFWSGFRTDHVPGSLHYFMRDLEERSGTHQLERSD